VLPSAPNARGLDRCAVAEQLQAVRRIPVLLVFGEPCQLRTLSARGCVPRAAARPRLPELKVFAFAQPRPNSARRSSIAARSAQSCSPCTPPAVSFLPRHGQLYSP
jgi:hypothetical protein